MIEVLVATTIMITLMLMLGMLFQQTSQAWRISRQRAEALKAGRTFYGILQRDISAAIDFYTLPTAMQEELKRVTGNDQPQSFSTSEFKFFTLTGTGFVSPEAEKSKGRTLRSLTYVTYDTDGRREETTYRTSAVGLEEDTSGTAKLLTPDWAGLRLLNVRFKVWYLHPNGKYNESAHNDMPGAPAGAFPTYVTIEADVEAATKTWEIGAASAGPDHIWDTDDDIKTWTDNES